MTQKGNRNDTKRKKNKVKMTQKQKKKVPKMTLKSRKKHHKDTKTH